jgi:hypothetical protein
MSIFGLQKESPTQIKRSVNLWRATSKMHLIEVWSCPVLALWVEAGPDMLWKAIERDKQQIALHLSHWRGTLWRDRWQTQLAKAFGISSRTVRRWVLHEAPIPWPLLDEILPSLFQAKADQLTRVCDEPAHSVR